MSFGRTVLVCFCVLLTLTSGLATAAPLRYGGATTLQRYFMPEAAQAFESATGIPFSIAGGNTDAGLQGVRNRRLDLAGAGRYLTGAEKDAGLREHLLGWDALVVVTHATNPVVSLSRAQLRGIFSGRIRNWKEVGGRDLPIQVLVAPAGSGIRAAIEELFLGPEQLLNSATVPLVIDDSDRQVAQWPGGITALSRSMVDAADVTILRVDGAAPTGDAIAAGRYPLLKPLLLVTRRGAPEAVERFVAFALGPEGQRLLGKHFFPSRPQQSNGRDH